MKVLKWLGEFLLAALVSTVIFTILGLLYFAVY